MALRGKKAGRRRKQAGRPAARKARRVRRPDPLKAGLRAVEDSSRELGLEDSRDAHTALAVVRAIERALQLIEVEGGSPDLRRALRKAGDPLAEFVTREQRRKTRARRRKA